MLITEKKQGTESHHSASSRDLATALKAPSARGGHRDFTESQRAAPQISY